jgi:hypothetical protein
MRHGFSDDFDNGWSDVHVVTETNEEAELRWERERVERDDYVNQQQAKDRLQKEAEVFASLVLDAFKRQAQDLFPDASSGFLFDREGLRNFADNAKWRYESEKGECAFPVKVLRGQIPLYFHADGTLSRE